MTVRPTSDRDRVWAELAAELTPAKSLVRIEAATGRVVATVAVVGALLAGLGGLVSASAVRGPARVLALVALVAAALAVVLALAAQLLTVNWRLNPGNLAEVETWYRRRFLVRAPLAQAATVVLVVAAVAAGAAGTLRATAGEPRQPVLAVTRTSDGAIDTVTVEVTFHDLPPGEIATATVTAGARLLAQATFTPDQDGTAAHTLAAQHVDPPATVTVTVAAGTRGCTAILTPADPRPGLVCHG